MPRHKISLDATPPLSWVTKDKRFGGGDLFRRDYTGKTHTHMHACKKKISKLRFARCL